MSRLPPFVIPAIVCSLGAIVATGFVWQNASWFSRRPPNNPEMAAKKTSAVGRIETFSALAKPAAPAQDYAGATACRACHQAIWDRYQSHPMSNSSATVENATALESFDQNSSFTVSTPIGDVEYRVEKTAEGVFHHESLTDPVLGPIYDQRIRVDYAIGSGRHGRSYVFAQEDCLFMSPITWYSDKSIWHLSPNYRPEKHPRFERRVVLACLVCHTERVSVHRDAPNHFPAPAILEGKIGCESCHGPGAQHIAFQEQRAQSANSFVGVDPVVNPVKLDPERRESVCWQCHFAAEERIPRFGRLDSDFRPGDRFDDIWVAFVRGLRLDEQGSMRVASHVEQTQASVCSQRSEGRFGCLSCHDPHSVPSEGQKVAFYREKCMACHAGQGCSVAVSERTKSSPADSCIACHMPSHGLNRVPHTSRTDHRILRRPQPVQSPNRDQPLSVYRWGDRELPQTEQDRAWGLVLAKIAYLQQDIEIARAASQKLAAVLPLVPEDDRVQEWLGVCEQFLNRPERAQAQWLQILERTARDEGALQRLADMSLPPSRVLETKEALTKYLSINSWQSSHQLRLAAICGDLGLWEEATSRAKESLRINPMQVTAHRILAAVYQRQGKSTEAEHHEKMARRLNAPR